MSGRVSMSPEDCSLPGRLDLEPHGLGRVADEHLHQAGGHLGVTLDRRGPALVGRMQRRVDQLAGQRVMAPIEVAQRQVDQGPGQVALVAVEDRLLAIGLEQRPGLPGRAEMVQDLAALVLKHAQQPGQPGWSGTESSTVRPTWSASSMYVRAWVILPACRKARLRVERTLASNSWSPISRAAATAPSSGPAARAGSPLTNATLPITRSTRACRSVGSWSVLVRASQRSPWGTRPV